MNLKFYLNCDFIDYAHKFIENKMYLARKAMLQRMQNNTMSFMQFSRMAFAMRNYDVAVIGGGPGGYVAAIKAG